MLHTANCDDPRPAKYRRHCWVWCIVGKFTVIACIHCDVSKYDWESDDGDELRADQSYAIHRERCDRAQLWEPVASGF